MGKGGRFGKYGESKRLKRLKQKPHPLRKLTKSLPKGKGRFFNA